LWQTNLKRRKAFPNLEVGMKRWLVILALLAFSGCAALSQLEQRPIDVNKASSAELQKLPDIGPAIAQRIIEGRPFITVNQLLDVKGIDRELLERIRPHVTVGKKGQ